jgi:heme-degrading monooxygenase HmoA
MGASIRGAPRAPQWDYCQDVSFAAVFLYEVDPGSVGAFEAVYGPGGDWARMFAAGDGYLGTELWRADDGRYLVMDRWRSAADYDAFLAAHASEPGAPTAPPPRLWRREQVLGRFDAA